MCGSAPRESRKRVQRSRAPAALGRIHGRAVINFDARKCGRRLHLRASLCIYIYTFVGVCMYDRYIVPRSETGHKPCLASFCVSAPREWALAHSHKRVRRNRTPTAQCAAEPHPCCTAADTRRSLDKYRCEKVRPCTCELVINKTRQEGM